MKLKPITIATVYLLSDVLPVLTQLSLVFQTADVDLSVIKPQVSATIASLKSSGTSYARAR